MQNLIEQKVKEFEIRISGTCADKNSQWWDENVVSLVRSSLLAVAEKAHEEGFEEAVEKMSEKIEQRRFDINTQQIGSSDYQLGELTTLTTLSSLLDKIEKDL